MNRHIWQLLSTSAAGGVCVCTCACVCVCEPLAQPPGLAAKPLPNQCRGPGWPSNSLSLMKNKPLKRHDCLRMRGKGTIPRTFHPPQGADPKGGCRGRAGQAGVVPHECPCTPRSPCHGCVGCVGRVCCRHNTRKPLQKKPPRWWLHPPVRAAWVPGSPSAEQGDPHCRHPKALHLWGELGAGCQVALGTISC